MAQSSLEAKSAFERGKVMPVPMLVFGLACLIGIAVQTISWRRQPSTDNLFLLIIVAFAFLPALWQVKLTYYAVWLATFTTVIAVGQIKGSQDMSAMTARLTAVFATNQASLLAIIGPAVVALGIGPTVTASTPASAPASVPASIRAAGPVSPGAAAAAALAAEQDSDRCRETSAISTLARLPKGFVISEIDTGPYIVALTQHSVLTAPYHRIDQSILAANRIFVGDVAQAEARLQVEIERFAPKGLPVYLLLCSTETVAKAQSLATQPSTTQPSTTQPLTPQSVTTSSSPPPPPALTFASALTAGHPFKSIERIDTASVPGAFKVWRVTPSSLAKP
jgi:hypothetical protein